MPNYYNPYNFYPATYQPMPYSQPVQQQSFGQQPAKMMEWVEGEVGAKAFQMPAGLPANQPIPLWDSTDTVIYLKSWSQMGIPNPMQKLRYEMPEQNNQAMLQSGATQPAQTSEAVTKDDLKSIRDEIANLKEMMTNRRNQNGPGNGPINKGGNGNA